jgi:hypothetical protein
MFKHLIKGFLAGIATTLLENYRQLTIQLLKIEAAKAYLHGVQVARWSALGLIGMGLVIGLICCGVLLFHVGLFMLLPWSIEAKAVLAMVLGLAYIAIGWFALHAAMNEKTWMEKSGAAGMLEEAIRPPKKD